MDEEDLNDLFTWVDTSFEDIREDDLIRSITLPVSQEHIGHPQADRKVKGRIITKGNTPETTTLDFNGEIVPLAYDGLGNDVTIIFLKGTTNTRGLWNRETGKRRKTYFGKSKDLTKNKIKEVNSDIKYLRLILNYQN